MVTSLGAILATSMKLMVNSHFRPAVLAEVLDMMERHHDWGTTWPGLVAILLPLIAVGALSLAAAFDLEARRQTFADMHEFLKQQRSHLEHALTFREFVSLLQATERTLLRKR